MIPLKVTEAAPGTTVSATGLSPVFRRLQQLAVGLREHRPPCASGCLTRAEVPLCSDVNLRSKQFTLKINSINPPQKNAPGLATVGGACCDAQRMDNTAQTFVA